ncbi:MAG: hypothetical protein IKQ17_00205 [Kiritimatiellae bacterium]|nr:hypothetical protein [Kiritimatiellia bacterium]
MTRSFAWRGSTWQRGATIKLSDNEAVTPFVASHVKPLQPDGPRGKTEDGGVGATEYLGNGEEKEKTEPPAKTIADAEGAQGEAQGQAPASGQQGEAQGQAPASGQQGEAQGQAPASGQQGELDLDGGAQPCEMTAKQLRDALGKLGVPCPPNAKRGELAALYENAKAAVAGSQEH